MTNTDKSCPTCGSSIPKEAPGGLCPKCVLEGAAATPVASTSTGRGTPPATVEEIAPHFSELEIIELMGAGGMGAVYKARQPQLDRFVALKILSHDLASDPAFEERFNREAKVLARLSHPNIVGVFDFGTAGPYCYLLMEFVDGVNLRQAMQTGGFTPTESLALVQDICSALKFAHEEGILHRDIKPENVLIDSKGRVKIADFGIAKLVGEDQQSDVTLTMQGSVLGSPHYMAPEQIETPGDVDQRADIYSLGVVFYELLTGELPIGRFALPSEKAAMDGRIDEIVMRTLEKERKARFQSAEEVMTQVGAVVQSPGAIPAAPAPVQSDPGTAPFSLLSAILTGLSLVGVVCGFYLGNEYRDWGLTRETGRVLSLIVLVLSAMMAITGFILGASALGRIRSSGGQKDGLGSAVFGVVVWPILLLGMFGSAFLSMPRPESAGGRSLGPLAVILAIGIPQILAGFVLVRGLRRWARGVVGQDGEERFPGIGRTVLAAIGLIVLGVVLLEGTSRLLPAGEGHDPFAESRRFMEEEEARVSAIIASSSASNDVDWFRGAPEAVLSLEVAPDLTADIRLLRIDTDAEEDATIVEEAKVATVVAPPGNTPITGQIKIGTFGTRGDGLASERGFAALLSDTDWRAVIEGETDFSGWEFVVDGSATLVFDEPGKYDIRVAQRRNEKGILVDFLDLEVRVPKR